MIILIIGIVTAMDEELEPYLSTFKMTEKHSMYGRNVFVSKTDKKNTYYFIVSGIGKVRSSSAAQILLSMGAEIIINVGTCCSLNPQHNVGDLLLQDKSVQVDSYYNKVPRSSSNKHYSDSVYLSLLPRTSRIFRVTGGTGDTFLHDNAQKIKLANDFGIECYDMETAAISDICEVSGTPFVCVRIVSDGMEGDSKKDFLENLKIVSNKLATYMTPVIQAL